MKASYDTNAGIQLILLD